MDKQSHAQKSVCQIYLTIPNFYGCTVDVWECNSNFIQHFVMDVITYALWDQS